MTLSFQREPESGLILLGVEIDNKFDLKMVLDTGATHTTIDINALYLMGYDLKDCQGKVEIETANGIIETKLFLLENFSALTLNKTQFMVQVYDFMNHGIISDYNGLIGLDFLKNEKFCIDLVQNKISLKT